MLVFEAGVNHLNMNNIRPIPTIHKGIKFRSRLEARWDVFFEAINFCCVYEPFMIENNNLSYTPDFYCNVGLIGSAEKPVLIEIKPKTPNKDYVDFLKKIHNPYLSDILICVGEPDLFQPDGYLIQSKWEKGGKRHTVVEKGFNCIRCNTCGRFTVNNYDPEFNFNFLSCERYHAIETGYNETAKFIAKTHRFDL